MNNDEISRFYTFCDEHELPQPDETLLRNRRWTWVLAYRLANPSLYRWPIFGALSEFMSKEEYCQTLRWLWSHSEGDLESLAVDISFTAHNRVGLTISDFLTPLETQTYESWPQTITIYRGCTDQTKEGLSWTKDYDIAMTFARRRAPESPSGKGLMLTATCDKANILCYILNDLNEYEVLVRPEQRKVTKEETVNP